MSLNEKEIISTAVASLQKGEVVLCPTDTIVGLSCDATNASAIERIAKLKQRPVEKSFIVLMASITMLEAYVEDIPEAAYQLLEASDNPVTIVYPSVRNLPEALKAKDGSLGIRVVQDGFTQRLIQRFRRPIVSTSANISGAPAPATRHEVENEILDAVDHVIPVDGAGNKASSIIQFQPDHSFKILRK